jgi:hypothetical protein
VPRGDKRFPNSLPTKEYPTAPHAVIEGFGLHKAFSGVLYFLVKIFNNRNRSQKAICCWNVVVFIRLEGLGNRVSWRNGSLCRVDGVPAPPKGPKGEDMYEISVCMDIILSRALCGVVVNAYC